MSKSAKLDNSEIAHVVQHAVEAALAAVLERKKKPPTRPSNKIVKAAAGPTKPPPKRGFRGTPPPADFSLADLSDDSLLTEYEAAAFTRLSTNTLAAWRRRDDPLLEWTTIGGGRCIRYRVDAVKRFIASGYRPQPGRPRKQDVPPAPAQDATSRSPARSSSRRRSSDRPAAIRAGDVSRA